VSFRKKLAELAVPRYKAWLSKMPQSFQDMRKESDLTQPDPAYYGRRSSSSLSAKA